MKQHIKKLILFAAPLTLLAFCLVAAKVKIICGGDSYTAYGFPFFWTMPGATSLSVAIDLTAFILDLIVYFAIFAGISATKLFDKVFARKQILTAALLWAAAAIVGGLFILVISFDLYSQKIVLLPCGQTHYAPHFGFPIGK